MAGVFSGKNTTCNGKALQSCNTCHLKQGHFRLQLVHCKNYFTICVTGTRTPRDVFQSRYFYLVHQSLSATRALIKGSKRNIISHKSSMLWGCNYRSWQKLEVVGKKVLTVIAPWGVLKPKPMLYLDERQGLFLKLLPMSPASRHDGAWMHDWGGNEFLAAYQRPMLPRPLEDEKVADDLRLRASTWPRKVQRRWGWPRWSKRRTTLLAEQKLATDEAIPSGNAELITATIYSLMRE